MSKGILLSGGIDSIALAFWKKPEFAFTVNYGQSPAAAEIEVSKVICRELSMRHVVLDVDCSKLGSGDLLKKEPLEIAPSTEWWPYRNQLLVTLTCMKAIGLGVSELMVGSVLSDGFHRDGTDEFYSLLNNLMVYQEGSIVISAPAIKISSAELVIKSRIPSQLLFYAHSCHRSSIPCGRCRGCNKYIEVIQQLYNANWEKS